MTGWAHAIAGVLVGIGMLIVVPLGLPLTGQSWTARRRALWLAAAACGAVSWWLPRGGPAVALAAVYLLAALWLITKAPMDVTIATALASPAVAASALVAERGGYALFGFDPDTLALTVAHFHYAGFCAALIAGLTRSRAAGLTVPAGIGLVLAGFFTSDLVELAGAMVLTAGMWWTAWLMAKEARALLVTGAAVLVVTMLLALDWAAGEATGLPHLSLSWMVATHGVANALGFALCAVLGYRKLSWATESARPLRRRWTG